MSLDINGVEQDFIEWTIKAHLNENCEKHRGFRGSLFSAFKAGASNEKSKKHKPLIGTMMTCKGCQKVIATDHDNFYCGCERIKRKDL